MSDFLDEFFEKLEKRLRMLERDIMKSVEEVFKNINIPEFRRTPEISETVEPLYTIKDLGDRIVIYIDLPYVAEGTIDVKFEDRTMYIYAKLKESVKLDRLSRRFRGVEVQEYRAAIELPLEPKPDKTKIRTRKGVVEITIYK
uniref:Hsp20/alpha crystallin family protein n=1 Tax=Ignisphaera aggregans TaxID=334771 RepID=A0A7C5TGY8_9CREN